MDGSTELDWAGFEWAWNMLVHLFILGHRLKKLHFQKKLKQNIFIMDIARGPTKVYIYKPFVLVFFLSETKYLTSKIKGKKVYLTHTL